MKAFLQFLLWGFEGDLAGNEARIMARLPVILCMPDGEIVLPRTANWSLSKPDTITWFTSETDATYAGTKLQTTDNIYLFPGQLIAVIGPLFYQDLVSVGTGTIKDKLTNWMSAQDDFRILCTTETDYNDFCFQLANHSKKVFDDEVALQAGARITDSARAALRLLHGNGFAHIDELIVRELAVVKINGDPDSVSHKHGIGRRTPQ